MATLSPFPAFPFLFSPKLVFFDPHLRLNFRPWTTRYPPPPVHFAVRASSSVKRVRPKAKSNEELCDELLEFIAAVGLPQGHVPSMKELSQHGRKDLAYIVRRRGYKLLRKLLSGSTDEVDDGKKDIVTGQDQEVNDVVEETSSLSEVSVLESNSETLVPDPVLNHNDGVDVPVESLADSLLQDTSSSNLEVFGEQVDSKEGNGHVSNSPEISKAFNSDNRSYVSDEIFTDSSSGMIEELSLPTTVPVQENNSGISNIASSLDMPFESDADWFSDRKALHRGQDGRNDNMGEEVSLSTKASIMDKEDHSRSDIELHNSDDMPVQHPADLSLEEKVKNFVNNGDPDTLEDSIYGVSIECDAEEIKDSKQFGNAEEVQLQTPTSENLKYVLDGSDATADDATSLADSRSSLPDNNLDVKTSEKDDQQDISRLKSMLHQKELELSRLKEQIEKEQHALSVLQANAETAISEAQKLILEKDKELMAAEENLSGLVEVEIQYHGDGEIVEVTGSFNGWHHQIKLDPQPSSSIIDHAGSRKSRLWSTMLWLYPGVYEIKFLVDGHWHIDPHRETVTRGTICNNILRVDG